MEISDRPTILPITHDPNKVMYLQKVGPKESLSLGDGFPEDLLKDIREILAPGAGRPADGQPFFLDILHSVALNIQDPDHQFFPGSGARAPDLAGHLATQEGAERGGAGVPGTPSPNRRITSASSSGAHFWRRSGGGPLQ